MNEKQMDDLISRNAAIDAVKHAWAKGIEPSQYIEIIPSVPAVPLEPLARFIVENLDPRVDCKTCATIREGWEDRECANCPKMSDEQVLDALKKWMEEQNG